MTESSDFKEELSTVADGERWGAADWDARRGEHPADELLLAYGAGRLDAGDESRLQEHLTTCAECRALVADLCAFPDLDAVEGEPSEFEVAAAWRGVTERIAAADRAAAAAPSRPANDHEPLFRRPSVAWVVAASFAVALLASQLWLGGQLSDARLQASIVEGRLGRLLKPTTGGIEDAKGETRGEATTVWCVAEVECVKWLTATQALLAADPHGLHWAIVSDDGAELWSDPLSDEAKWELADEGGFRLTLPPGSLALGTYQYRLLAAGVDEPLYLLRIEVVEEEDLPPRGQRDDVSAAIGGA